MDIITAAAAVIVTAVVSAAAEAAAAAANEDEHKYKDPGTAVSASNCYTLKRPPFSVFITYYAGSFKCVTC
ncbi:MAG: hypothetical protein ACLR56_10865 [Oscillospiraceae bacterium]